MSVTKLLGKQNKLFYEKVLPDLPGDKSEIVFLVELWIVFEYPNRS